MPWRDVFLTKPDYGQEGTEPVFDDEFIAPVMSVHVQRQITRETDLVTSALVTTDETHVVPAKGGSAWLALAYPANADTNEINKWRSIKAGDTLRVGTSDTRSPTGLMSVLETVDGTHLYNTSATTDFEIEAVDTNSDSYRGNLQQFEWFVQSPYSSAADVFAIPTGVGGSTLPWLANGDRVYVAGGGDDFVDGFYRVENKNLLTFSGSQIVEIQLRNSAGAIVTRSSPTPAIFVDVTATSQYAQQPTDGISAPLNTLVTRATFLKSRSAGNDTNSYIQVGVLGGLPEGSLRCIRVDISLDATTLPSELQPHDKFNSVASSSNQVSDATRGHCVSYYPCSPDNDELDRGYKGSSRREQFFYPCYRVRPTPGVFELFMPSDIKRISAVRLMNYTVVSKQPNAGDVSLGHETKVDDWYAMHIDGVPGQVLSNNRYANGAFHILQASRISEDRLWASDANPEGLAVCYFTPVNIPCLRVALRDRHGEKPNFGRMHLWLQVYN